MKPILVFLDWVFFLKKTEKKKQPIYEHIQNFKITDERKALGKTI